MAPVNDVTRLTDPRVHGGTMGRYDPDGIVLHHTGSSDEHGDAYWLSQYHNNPVSTNQMIQRDGTIVQIVPNDVVAWHAGTSCLNGRWDCNGWCIGLEICNNGVGEAFTDAQYQTVAETVAYNCALFMIDDADVSSHARVAECAGRSDKYDPYGWDWPRMWSKVDAIRASWPWTISLWYNTAGQRVMSTE